MVNTVLYGYMDFYLKIKVFWIFGGFFSDKVSGSLVGSPIFIRLKKSGDLEFHFKIKKNLAPDNFIYYY